MELIDIYTIISVVHTTVDEGINAMMFGVGFVAGSLLLTAFSFWKW